MDGGHIDYTIVVQYDNEVIRQLEEGNNAFSPVQLRPTHFIQIFREYNAKDVLVGSFGARFVNSGSFQCSDLGYDPDK